MPLIFCFWFFLILTFFRNGIWAFLCKHLKFLRVAEMELDEGLPNYFETLDDHDRTWSIKEEKNCREIMKFELLN